MLSDLSVTEIGGGRVMRDGDTWRLLLPPVAANLYADAQLSTYRLRQDFRHRPPLGLQLRARFSGRVPGTAGFGFWNHPFGPGMRGVRLPSAVWFFYGSPLNNMSLARGVPGCGWKAAQIDTSNAYFLSLLPTAPVAIFLMRSRPLYRWLWPVAQRAMRVNERLIAEVPDDAWHDYDLRWTHDSLRFSVDGDCVLESRMSPRGPLGFVAWIDNQYAVVTPQGKFGFGVAAGDSGCSLEIAQLAIAES